MNLNAGGGSRPSQGRKLKRVVDVNAMGYSPYAPTNPYPNGANVPQNQHQQPQQFQAQPPMQDFMNPQGFEQPVKPSPYAQGGAPNVPFNAGGTGGVPNVPGMGLFAQPMVQDMALQYGQQLADKGTHLMKTEIEKFVPVSRLKYYFAVDTNYVLTKLRLLFFPFTHTDWSIKFEQDGPVQPRFEINAPDLYIPTMAYITYVLVASLVLGMQQRFSPEQIGIQASSALAWCILELIIYSITLYIANIETSLRTLDLLAYSGYKFVGIITSILLSLLGTRTAYYASLAYTNTALAFFLVRALKIKVLPETSGQTSYYGEPPATGNKRRKYFLLFVAAIQPFLSWWLSFHLLATLPTVEKTGD